ncbi:MAG: alpha/beta fold hydrolase, partial [Rectinemataceae bacterium]
MDIRRFALLPALAFSVAFSSLNTVSAQAIAQAADPGTVARNFITAFFAKDPAYRAMMTDAMKTAFSDVQAAGTADQLLARCGSFSGLGKPAVEARSGTNIVSLRGSFDRYYADFRVTIGGTGKDTGKVAGFFVVRLENRAQWDLPPYAKAGSWTDEPASVDAGGWPLPGTLSIPKGKGPFPAVVLVHGSGPNDRNETIGPNKVFADIALGLASRGIAVLRYDKRTLVHSARLSAVAEDIDVRSETVDDAVAALSLLSRDPRVDGRRIIIVGHSLGAMLGPMIAAAAASAGSGLHPAALVLVAPNARPLEDVIVDQVRYLSMLQPGNDEQKSAGIAELVAAAARVKALGPAAEDTDPEPSELPLAIPAAWWRSLAGYNPVTVARGLGLPLLVIHGSRDYQVMSSEATAWKSGLSGQKDATTMLMPNLNHLMMRGSGPANPAEYDTPGHVDATVIEAVASFVGRL